MGHARIDRLAIFNIDPRRIVFHAIDRLGKRLRVLEMRGPVCVLCPDMASCLSFANLFENDKVGSGRMLSRGILRDNFQDVGSGFVERFFHRVLQA